MVRLMKKSLNENETLQTKTLQSMIYSFGGFISKSGIDLILGIVLARLLLPEDYGLLGMIMIFMAVSERFIDSGMTQALIREKDVDVKDYSTVFYYNLGVALVVYFALFLSAGLISNFYNEPSLTLIVRVAGLSIVIGAFGLIQSVILVRELNFKVQSIIQLGASLLSGTIAIYFAYQGFGVWALIIKMISLRLITSIVYLMHNRWRPLLVFNIQSFKRYFNFGYKLLLTGILATIYQNIYNVIIGRFYSKNELGYYTKSKQFSDLAALSVTTSVTSVSYPVLSLLQDKTNLLEIGFSKIIKYSSFITFPIMIGLAVIAEPFVSILLGENWLPMVPYFQVLSLSAATLPHRSINLNVLKVKGRSDLFLKLEVIKMVIGLITIISVVLLEWGITGLLITVFVNSQIAFFINASYSKKFIHYSAISQFKDMIKPLIIAITMGIISYIIGFYLPFNVYINLLTQVTVGMIIYLLLSLIFKVEELRLLFGLVKSLLIKK